jgi:hypothetical protein
VPGFPMPPLLAALLWEPYGDVGSLGVPAGCKLETAVRRATLPAGTVRFVAPAGGSSELLLAVDRDGDGAVDQDGVIDAAGRVAHPLPWTTLDSPPIVSKGATGFLAFDTEDTGRGVRRSVMWRDPGRIEPLIEGERLDVVDASCDASTCAVLTTFASASAGPGATVLVGDPHAPASSWRRTDIPGAGTAWAPFSVVRVHEGVAWVALTAPGALSVFRVEQGRAASLGRIDAPFGAYDVVLGDSPIAVAPGESIDDPCKKDGFPVRLLRPSQDPLEIDGQVPPTSVLTRPLSTGFLVAWLSPVSCRHDGRNLVRAFLVAPDGTPASSTMAVSDAQGVALATHGDSIDLWLAVGHDLVWVKATCRIESAANRPKKDGAGSAR